MGIQVDDRHRIVRGEQSLRSNRSKCRSDVCVDAEAFAMIAEGMVEAAAWIHGHNALLQSVAHCQQCARTGAGNDGVDDRQPGLVELACACVTPAPAPTLR
ncbi:MAG: hypothetical protein ABIR54_10745 [Burkholderiaceae bacterium]